jgi:uncharacterized protein YjbI with pentapeptide repeats
VALGVFLAVISLGYAYKLRWVGVVDFKDTTYKTLWDWLQLLSALAIPVVLALGGYLFTRSENRRAHEIADERRQDDMLQAYLNGMSQLLTDKEHPLHRAEPGDNLSTVARARTLTVLSRLDGGRKRSILQFLYESRLIDQEQALLDESDLIKRRRTIVSLAQADLGKAYLRDANLKRAYLRDANLSRAYLRGADLSWAKLLGAKLEGTYLEGAYLGKAFLEGAYLRRANLEGAYLTATYLEGADLSGADLSRAKRVTNVELERQAKSLKGATMPNGQKYEEWLKDKEGREEDGENSSPS